MVFAARGQRSSRAIEKRWLWGAIGLLVCIATGAILFSAARPPAASVTVITEVSRAERATRAAHDGARRPARGRAAALHRDGVSARPTAPLAVASDVPTGFELEISGAVVDATGGGVVGAVVSAQADSAQLAWTSSGADGHFTLRLPPGHFEIVARAEAYSEAMSWVRAPARGVRLVLAPSASLAGRVVSRVTGEPIAGVTVNVEGPEGSVSRPRSTRAGSDGVFSFSGLARGRYQLEASGAAWRSQRQWARVEMGEQATGIELAASPAGVLVATVLVQGEPCADGFVRVQGAIWSNAPVHAGGARVEGVVPGSYEVNVGCEPGVALTETVQLGLGLTSRSWDLSAGSSLRGSVLSAEGQPLAAAHVRVLPAADVEGSNVDCVSDAGGDFECRGLVPGKYTCEVVGDFGPLSEPLRVIVGAADVPEVVLTTFASATIRASVSSSPSQRVASGVFARRAGYPAVLGTEAAGGQVSFENVPLGSYVVYVGAGGEHEPHARTLRLDQAGQVVEVALSAPPTTELVGSVLDARGEPLVDAWVRASGSGSGNELPAVLTDAEGRFAISDVLASARYDVKVDSNDGSTLRSGVTPGAPLLLQVRASDSAATLAHTER
jgi:carboxypeptidase family protein